MNQGGIISLADHVIVGAHLVGRHELHSAENKNRRVVAVILCTERSVYSERYSYQPGTEPSQIVQELQPMFLMGQTVDERIRSIADELAALSTDLSNSRNSLHESETAKRKAETNLAASTRKEADLLREVAVLKTERDALRTAIGDVRASAASDRENLTRLKAEIGEREVRRILGENQEVAK